MLPRLNRLTGSSNFELVAKNGKVHQSPSFGVAFIDRKDSQPSRFAFIVSTKIAKEAVERNRIKRILREAVRQSLFESRSGFDIVFLAKQSIVRVSTELIAKEVRKSLKDAGLTK